MTNELVPPVPPALLEVRDLSKHFGGVRALVQASLRLPAGTTVALAGENGAGKSTLIKILSGAIRPDAGQVMIDGREAHIRNPSDAAVNGIATVYQELSLLPYLSVAENLFLGQYPRRLGAIRWRQVRNEAGRLLDELGLQVRPQALVATLGLPERYLVEIAKAVRHNPRIMILDEPTAALDPNDAEQIFRLMERLREGGTGIIFVSHRLDELRRCAQAYMVLKDGTTTGEGAMADISERGLVALMLGQPSQAGQPGGADAPVTAGTGRATPGNASGIPAGEARLWVSHLSTLHIRDVSFTVRAGEIVGVAGLRGSGQSQLCRALVGADKATAGTMELGGSRFAPRSPHQAWRRGVCLLPIERKSEGLFPNLSVASNISYGPMVNRELGWVTRRRQHALASQYRDSLDIRLPGGQLDVPVGALSGGNQQKVVLARLLAGRPAVLVLDEPTRGVDVGAKAQIHALITGLAAAGVGVVVSSSELDELMSLSTKLLVMHRGEVAAEIGHDFDEQTIIGLASGSDMRFAAGGSGLDKDGRHA
ncbi:MAG: sugar ABC transporter ATP-binding protein [Streptosporangiaceae bacterium]